MFIFGFILALIIKVLECSKKQTSLWVMTDLFVQIMTQVIIVLVYQNNEVAHFAAAKGQVLR